MIRTEQHLAELFAIVDTKAWIVADEEFDYRYGTKQHVWAMEHTDRWFDLLDELKNEIFAILRNEGVTIPETKQIEVLKPFMARNGYMHTTAGWSRKAKESKEV